jgi:2-oxoisovalerate dehydrogenase E1 component subunit alpha
VSPNVAQAMPSVHQSSFHVPEPPSRPNREGRYGHYLSAAGDVDKPALDVSAAEIWKMAYALIRVLDDDDVAKGLGYLGWMPRL